MGCKPTLILRIHATMGNSLAPSHQFVGLGSKCQELSPAVHRKIQMANWGRHAATSIKKSERNISVSERVENLQRTAFKARQSRYFGQNWLVATPRADERVSDVTKLLSCTPRESFMDSVKPKRGTV